MAASNSLASRICSLPRPWNTGGTAWRGKKNVKNLARLTRLLPGDGGKWRLIAIVFLGLNRMREAEPKLRSFWRRVWRAIPSIPGGPAARWLPSENRNTSGEQIRSSCS